MLLEAHRMNTSNKRVLQVESEFSSLKYIRFHLTLGISLDLSSFMLPWKIMTSVSRAGLLSLEIFSQSVTRQQLDNPNVQVDCSDTSGSRMVLSQFSVAELLEVPGSKPSPKSAT